MRDSPPRSARHRGRWQTRWLYWTSRVDIYVLVLIPTLLGILIIALSEYVARGVYGPTVPEDYRYLEAALGTLMISMGGLVQVWRREGPGPLGGAISGRVPVVLGWLWAIACWLCALVALMLALRS